MIRLENSDKTILHIIVDPIKNCLASHQINNL